MITENKVERTIDETVLETVRSREDETIEYYLYRGRKDGRDSFSIQAIQYKRGVKICQATACDVSSVCSHAAEIFDAVSRGFVEPYVLCDVVYDLLP